MELSQGAATAKRRLIRYHLVTATVAAPQSPKIGRNPTRANHLYRHEQVNPARSVRATSTCLHSLEGSQCIN